VAINIESVLANYNKDDLTIGVLGGHSALDVCSGAKERGFRTVAICQKGRDLTYSKYYKTRNGKGCVDEVILVDKFADIVKPEIQEQLRAMNTIFVHNRYFWVYCNFEEIEKEFNVPIFGTREMLKLEERDVPNNQYILMEKAGIRIPKIIRQGGTQTDKATLDKAFDNHFVTNKGGPLLVKANEAIRSYERAFFVITNQDDFYRIGADMIKNEKTTQANIDNAVIEEFIIGAQVNFNFFYSSLTGELELMGTDMRRQTSMDGFLRLDSVTQSQLITSGYKPSMVENGHVAITVKESILEKAFAIGEKFVEISKKEAAPGIIGPFALQGAVDSQHGTEEIVIFDVSMRIPGSPGTRFTPYSGYLYGQPLSFGDRIAMEIRVEAYKNTLHQILT